MWVRVVSSIHGKEGGLGVVGGLRSRGRSSVWLDIIKTGSLIDSFGINFSGSFGMLVGDGLKLVFGMIDG